MKTWIIFLISAMFLISACSSSYNAPAAQPQQTTPVQGQQQGYTPQAAAAQKVQATGNAIEISGFAFNPAEITVKVGDTVTWTNKDPVQHQIASDSGNELSSSPLSNGDTYSHTFSTAGTYAYHCAIHTSMKGTVVVE